MKARSSCLATAASSYSSALFAIMLAQPWTNMAVIINVLRPVRREIHALAHGAENGLQLLRVEHLRQTVLRSIAGLEQEPEPVGLLDGKADIVEADLRQRITLRRDG